MAGGITVRMAGIRIAGIRIAGSQIIPVRMAAVGVAAGPADGGAVGIAIRIVRAVLPLEKLVRVVHQRDALVDDVDRHRFRGRIPERDRHRPAAVLCGVVEQHRQNLAGAGSGEIADRSGFGDVDAERSVAPSSRAAPSLREIVYQDSDVQRLRSPALVVPGQHQQVLDGRLQPVDKVSDSRIACD